MLISMPPVGSYCHQNHRYEWIMGLWPMLLVCLLLSYILATSKVIISGRLMTVCTHGDFIMLPHWESRPPAPWPDIPLTHIISDTVLTSPCPFLIMLSAWLGSDKYKPLSHWFDSTSIWRCEVRNPRSPKNRRRPLYSFSHPIWCPLYWEFDIYIWLGCNVCFVISSHFSVPHSVGKDGLASSMSLLYAQCHGSGTVPGCV